MFPVCFFIANMQILYIRRQLLLGQKMYYSINIAALVRLITRFYQQNQLIRVIRAIFQERNKSRTSPTRCFSSTIAIGFGGISLWFVFAIFLKYIALWSCLPCVINHLEDSGRYLVEIIIDLTVDSGNCSWALVLDWNECNQMFFICPLSKCHQVKFPFL